MPVCDVCRGMYDVGFEKDGDFFCSIECYEAAKANPELYKKAKKGGYTLL